jgi:predicted transcriptional regulator of viral defense system
MKYQEFRDLINKPFFRKNDVNFKATNVSSVQLSRWMNTGYISQVKRGLYVFGDEKSALDPSIISFLLYEPSYISLESALSFYCLIPELVPVTTAVSPKTTRIFENQYGKFSYRRIRPELFFGYVSREVPSGKYLIAEPEKAVLDYIYFNQSSLNSTDDINEWRINTEEFKNIIDISKLKKYLKEYNSKQMEKITELLLNHVNI